MAASLQAMVALSELQRFGMRSDMRPLDANRAQKKAASRQPLGMVQALKPRCLLQESRLHITHKLGVHHLLEGR